ncbi:MAG: hypothetical protein U0V48_03590 [Anaerolineales bacterium]
MSIRQIRSRHPQWRERGRILQTQALTESLLEKTKLLDAAPILITPVPHHAAQEHRTLLCDACGTQKFPQAALVVTGR